ncbi:MAG TPA: hypothetical protein VLM42_06935 [Bryobacteraceae bacterium]|nr:hypothetical protein [Bryobacteraceae bacterium]
MGLDQRTLQLVLNVVLVTGVTSLAIICHLLRQDNKKLALQARFREQQERYISARQGHESECMPALNVPVAHQDIRQFVARRSQEWNKVSDSR